MPKACKNHFRPQRNEEFVGEIMYRRHGQTEIDHDLYFDHDAVTVFVVCSESRPDGPALSNSHTRHTVDEFLGSYPGHRQRVADILRVRLGRA